MTPTRRPNESDEAFAVRVWNEALESACNRLTIVPNCRCNHCMRIESMKKTVRSARLPEVPT